MCDEFDTWNANLCLVPPALSFPNSRDPSSWALSTHSQRDRKISHLRRLATAILDLFLPLVGLVAMSAPGYSPPSYAAASNLVWKSIRFEPGAIVLSSPGASQHFVVSGIGSGGRVL